MRLRTRVLICSAVLGAIVLMAVPGGRSFASELAAKIGRLRPAATAGPLPFILDLHKHKRAPKTPPHAHPGPNKPARG